MSDIRPIDQQEVEVMAALDAMIQRGEVLEKIKDQEWFKELCTLFAQIQADALSKVLQTRGDDRSEWVGVAKTFNYLQSLIAAKIQDGRLAHTRKEELLHNIQIAVADAHEISDELRYHGHGAV